MDDNSKDDIRTDGRKDSRTKAIRAGAAVAGMIGLGAVALAVFGLPGNAESSPPQRDMRLDAATRNAVIDGVVSNLDAYYVFPDKAKSVSGRLRERANAGEFDDVTSAEALAETLTRTLQDNAADKHLEVRYFEQPQTGADGAGSESDAAAEALHQKRLNYGLSEYARLKGNIGYIDLHAFGRPSASAAKRYAAAMAMVEDTDALIVDLRECDGGDPESVMLFASYFFDKPAHLNDVYWRDENRTEARWTDPNVAGKRYGETRNVYLLTSEETFSGCEDFAYAMKYAKRATLVGETTGGGAHAGSPHLVSPHFMIFVPSGRPINPVTQTDWEGVGVVPDVRSSAKDAQQAAHMLALKTLISVETDEDWKAGLQRTLDKMD